MQILKTVSLMLVTIAFIFSLSCSDTGEKLETDEVSEQNSTNSEQTEEVSSAEVISEIDSRTLLSRISSKLSSAITLKVSIVTGYDVMQEIGQKLEFGDKREVYIERPQNILVKIQERRGDRHQFLYNGKMINYSSPDEKVYAEVELEGNIEDAIKHFTDDLQTHLPLSELFSVNLNDTINQKVTSSAIVDRVYINGKTTHHIAMRTEEIDAQIWADVSTDLPAKIILTYKHEPGQPQFRAVFDGWEIDQVVDSSNFLIDNSDFQKIQFMPVDGGIAR